VKKHLIVPTLFFICIPLFSLHSFSQAITNDTTLANQFFDLARKFENDFKIDSAIFNAEKSQTLNIKYFGEKSVKNANVLHLLGRLCYRKNKYDLALKYDFKALQIRKEILGENHTDVSSSYNNIGIVYDSNGEYDMALKYYFKSLEIDREINGEKHPFVAAGLDNIGIVYEKIGEHNQALEYGFKALQIRKEIFGENSTEVANTYNNIGLIYGEKGEHDKALEYYFKALQIRKEILDEKNPEVAAIYSNMGLVFYYKGEYNKSLEYYFTALQIYKELYKEKHPFVASTYDNIGSAYNDKGEYDKALESHFKALQIRKEILDENHPDVAASYNNIGIVYYETGENDKALEYFFKALQIKKEILGGNHPDLASSYNNIGNVYSKKGDYKKALDYNYKSLQIEKEINGEKHPNVAASYENIGNVYSFKGEYDRALEYFQKGAASCLNDFNDTVDVYNIPIIRGYLNWNSLLPILQSKAEIIADENKILKGIKDSDRGKIALRHYQACDTLIDITRKKITAQSDKLALGEQASKIYGEAIDLLIPILPANNGEVVKKMSDEDRNLAFYFSEKNKSTVLLQALAGQEALKFAGIPDSLLQKEHLLKTDITFYTKKLAEPELLDSTQHVLYQDRLFRRNRSIDSLILVFEKQFPEYHNLKYNNKPAKTKDIQKLLDRKTALISYFLGDTTITIFTLTKSNLDVKRVPKMTNLNDSIVFFRYGLTLGMPKIYRRLGYKLYQQLFPDAASIDGQIENLYIVPDGSLATLPFESLLTENYAGDINAYIDYPYLIKKYNISYSYSANLVYLTFSKEASSTIEITKLNDWLGFAPVFDNRSEQSMVMSSQELQRQLSGLKTDSMMINRSMFNEDYISPLPATEIETEAIFKLYDDNNLKAKVLLHDNANEKSVKSDEIEQYRILHFATHGFINSERPELSGLLMAQDTTGGEDGVLYSGEIYNLKLNADLVVLSACETGLGKIQKGEGIIGLTRALLYAGGKNIIVSLWQVLDESTSDLLVDFYKNSLASKRQLSYSEALKNAKLKMISEGKYANPFFWSPFILIGK
jgi:CHAT domain-containing protein/Tfp pilus assembly protein PilF